MDRTALRLAESNLLRAEAAVEKHFAATMRAGNGNQFMDDDKPGDELRACVADARADLLLCQAEYLLHGDDKPEEGS